MLKLGQQVIQSVDKAYGVLKLFAQAEHRLVKKDPRPVREFLLIPFISHLENDGMLRMDLHDRLGTRYQSTCGLQQPLEAGIDVIFIDAGTGSGALQAS